MGVFVFVPNVYVFVIHVDTLGNMQKSVGGKNMMGNALGSLSLCCFSCPFHCLDLLSLQKAAFHCSSWNKESGSATALNEQ